MIRFTHVGGPTLLVEVAGWRLLTDPTFDPPGRHYAFGWGTSSTKLAGPAVAADDLGPLDAVPPRAAAEQAGSPATSSASP